MTDRQVKLTEQISVGRSQKLLLIAGPCQIETLDHCLMIGSYLKDLCQARPVNLIFKASFDKANRTSQGSQRGPGIDQGLTILAQVRRQLGLAVITDIHEPAQARLAAEHVDILQIPAFLCRQTDLLQAAGKENKAILIKKGQFLHPADMEHAAAKVAASGNNKILLCERGSCFGYRDLVLDPRSLVIMRKIGYPVVFDASHTVQNMGGSGGASGGNRDFILPLARAAAAVGIDGLFVECHQDPESAPSDKASMLPLDKMEQLLDQICLIWEKTQHWEA